MKRSISVSAAGCVCLLLTFGRPASGIPQEVTDYGPPNGTLVIVGGGATDEIMERFIELGGGAEEGRFVIVPTAGGNYEWGGYPRIYREDRVLAPWRKRGVRNVSMLHTHNPKVADREDFVSELAHATAVWFAGGRQWHLVDSYAGTRTYEEFHKVLERGGVIGGSSAGATIQGEYLVRGDTEGSQIVMTDEEEHQLGFEFLRKTAIDAHINTRARWEDLIPVVEAQPHLLGIGLSEGTAIIVRGDVFEVVGESMVAVHDNTDAYPWGTPVLLLVPGDVYDMKTRRIVDPDGAFPTVSGRHSPPRDSMAGSRPESIRFRSARLAMTTDPEARLAPIPPLIRRGPSRKGRGAPNKMGMEVTTAPPTAPHNATRFRERSSSVFFRSATLRIRAKDAPAMNPPMELLRASRNRDVSGNPATAPRTAPSPIQAPAQVNPVPTMPRTFRSRRFMFPFPHRELLFQLRRGGHPPGFVIPGA